MSIASGARVLLTYMAEVTPGTTPASPDFKTLRATSRNPNVQINTLESNEVRVDREIADSRHGFTQVGGSIGYELGVQSYDDFLEAALSGTWAAVAVVTGCSATSLGNKFTRASGSFITGGYRVGDIIRTTLSATSGNNATWRVIEVSALYLVVDGTLVTDAGAGITVTYPGKRLDIGTTLRTFSIERQFQDVALYQLFKGVAIGQMSLDIKPEAIVGGTFTLIGMDGTTAMSGTSIDSTPTAAPTNSPIDSFHGSIYEGLTAIAVCTGLSLTLDNGRSVGPVVASRFSPEVFEGRARTSGTLMSYFRTAALFNKFVNETESSIWIKLDDPNGTDFLNVVLPRVKYNGGPIEPPSDGPIVISLPIQALRDSTAGTSLSIQRSNT